MERLRELLKEEVKVKRAEECGYKNCLDGDIVVVKLKDLDKLGALERYHVIVVLPEGQD